MNLILFAVIGLVVGALAAWVTRQRELSRTYRDIREASAAAVDLNRQLAAAEALLQEARDQLHSVRSELNNAHQETITERLAREKSQRDYLSLEISATERLRAADDKLKLLQSTEAKLKTEFENLANQIFQEKTQQLSTNSTQNINTLLGPFRQQLAEFKDRINQIHAKDIEDRSSLNTQITNLQNASASAGSKAEQLARAIVGDSRVRGDLGEMSLERILEDCGLRASQDYLVQSTHTAEDGQKLRPDVVVNLPGKKSVVIDSKVSLVAYLEWHGASSDEKRQRCLGDHVTALRRHVRDLSKKNYQDAIGSNSLDLVLMFVPIESAYLVALQHDAALYADAFNRSVLIVGPTTLMATLQIIDNIWRYERQSKNAMEIGERAGGLYDQFVLFTESFRDLGARLEQAQVAYTTTYKRLSQGNGNLVDRAQKLIELGAKAKRKLSPEIIAVGSDDAAPAIAVPAKEDLAAAGQSSIDLWSDPAANGVVGGVDGVEGVPF